MQIEPTHHHNEGIKVLVLSKVIKPWNASVFVSNEDYSDDNPKEFIIKTLESNNSIEWVIYDTNYPWVFHSGVSKFLYETYPNLKFIFTSSGYVFGNSNWNESTEIDEYNPEQEFLEIISKEEIVSNRVWTLRYELFDEMSISNIDFSEDRVYHGAIDIKRSMITKTALNSLIQTIVENHTQIKEGTYHIIPKDTHTEYELLNYVAWKKGKSPYIERATSNTPINHILKTSKYSELEKIWSLSKYRNIPSFKELFDEL